MLAVLLPLSIAALVMLLMAFFSKRIKSEKETKEVVTADNEAKEELPATEEENALPETETFTEPADSPTALTESEALPETESEPLPEYEDTTMLFTGDVLLWDGTLARYQEGGVGGIVDDAVLSEFQNADILMINEEFPFSTRGEQADKQFTFRCDPQYVSAFQEMSVDIVTLANNHTLDFGRDALSDSFDTLDAAGIPYVGAGRDLNDAKKLVTFEMNGLTFGFLGASRVWPDGNWSASPDQSGCFGTYDPTQLLEEIRKAKEVCDFLTVFVHWGIERNTSPEDYQVAMAAQYAEAGADLTIGSHPHVLQGAGFAGDMPVFYSFGNFIFNTRSYDTAIVKVVVTPEKEASFYFLPAHSDGGKVSMLSQESGTALFSYLNDISLNASVDLDGKVTKSE